MKLHLQSDKSVTLIENTFIDRYMPAANGEFVKLYLYLLRCAGTGRELSISSIADFFDHTEGDVRRALAYWEKLNLIRIAYGPDGSLSDILLLETSEQPQESPAHALPLSTPRAAAEGAAAQAGPDAVSSAGEAAGTDREAAEVKDLPEAKAAPSRSAISPARRRALCGQAQIQQLIFVGHQYLSRPLTSTEVNNLLYFYDVLHFDPDLIEYLIEYCASRGNPGTRYMEKIALSWYDKGITTVEEAKRESTLYNKNYYAVLHAMGINGRGPAEAETEFIDRWLTDYGFPLDLILEACSRTIIKTHQPSFTYADGILKSWKEQGVRCAGDIRRLDKEYSQKKAPAGQAKGAPAAGAKNQGTKNPFNNFPQRDYDWSALEAQIMEAQSGKKE